VRDQVGKVPADQGIDDLDQRVFRERAAGVETIVDPVPVPASGGPEKFVGKWQGVILTPGVTFQAALETDIQVGLDDGMPGIGTLFDRGEKEGNFALRHE